MKLLFKLTPKVWSHAIKSQFLLLSIIQSLSHNINFEFLTKSSPMECISLSLTVSTLSHTNTIHIDNILLLPDPTTWKCHKCYRLWPFHHYLSIYPKSYGFVFSLLNYRNHIQQVLCSCSLAIFPICTISCITKSRIYPSVWHSSTLFENRTIDLSHYMRIPLYFIFHKCRQKAPGVSLLCLTVLWIHSILRQHWIPI